MVSFPEFSSDHCKYDSWSNLVVKIGASSATKNVECRVEGQQPIKEAITTTDLTTQFLR
jgi:hypothetical protein